MTRHLPNVREEETIIEIKDPLLAFNPPRDGVLIRPKRLRSKLILSETLASKLFHEGTVVAIGEGSMNMQGVVLPPAAKIGDRVLVTSMSQLFKIRMLLPDSPIGEESGKQEPEVLYAVTQDEILGILEYAPKVEAVPQPEAQSA